MPCIMPEMPYCPACKYGHICAIEGSDTDTEWICTCTDEDVEKMNGGAEDDRLQEVRR